MNKKIVDGRLYREAFRQGKLIGLTSLVVLTLISVLSAVGRFIEKSNEVATIANTVSFYQVNPFVLVVMYVLGPLILLYLLRFVGSRNSADFYHSIPQTRLCVFLSFFLAALTWMTLLVAVPVAVGTILLLQWPAFFKPDVLDILNVAVHVWVGGFYLMTIVAVGVGLTGTIFTNIVVSLMIFFLPRLFLDFVTNLVADALPFLTEGYILPFPTSMYNIPMGAVTGELFDYVRCGYGAIKDSLTAVQSLIYTGIWTVIWLVVSARLFIRRRSETAGQASISPRVQAACRILATLTFCLIPIGLIFMSVTSKYYAGMDSEEVYTYITLYIVAIVLYFLYELITTRKAKNLVKAIPGLAIVAVLNVALLGGMLVYTNIAKSYQPSADEIEWISIQMKDGYTRYHDSSYPDYFAEKTSGVRLTDPEMKQLVSECLAKTVNGEDKDIYNSQSYRVPVAISTGGMPTYRTITFSRKDYARLVERMGEQDSFREVYRLPENPYGVSIEGFSDEEAREIYEVMRQEAEELPFETWYLIAENQNYDNGYSRMNMVTIVEKIDGYLYSSVMSPSTEMPKTTLAFAEKSISHGEVEKVLDELKQEVTSGEINFWIELMVTDPENEMQAYRSYYAHADNYDDEQICDVGGEITAEDAIRILESADPKPDLSHHLFRVNGDFSHYETGEGFSTQFYVTLPDDIAEEYFPEGLFVPIE